MWQRKQILLNIQYPRLSFRILIKTILKLRHIPNFYELKFLYPKTKNVFSLNNLELKIMKFQNKFYLYNQNLALWKKNNTNNMNTPEKD
jgi:hypothetical protein